MNQREVRWERMFPDGLEAGFAASEMACLPNGLREPNRPQSTVGMDALRLHSASVRWGSGGEFAGPPDPRVGVRRWLLLQ